MSLAFGLTVLTMAYAVGHVSGGHFNPAVTIGLWAGWRFPAKDIAGYVAVQVIGGILAAFAVLYIAQGHPGWSLAPLLGGALGGWVYRTLICEN